MPIVVSNSTPRVHRAKIGRLDLSARPFGPTLAPPAVWSECVPEMPDQPDARRFGEAT